MITGRLRGWACVAGGLALVTACFTRGAETGDESASQEVGTRPSALGAVVALESGCTATKVGPKHFLVAASCATNNVNIAIGKPLRYKKGNVKIDTSAPPPPSDASAPTPERDASASSDSGASEPREAGVVTADGEAFIEAKIAKFEVHQSYLRVCGTGACAMGKPGGAEIADLAIIVVQNEIEDLPTAPIELDPVSAGAKVLVVGNGCEAGVTPKLRARETTVAPSDAAAHQGSPYPAEAASALAGSYVTTRGPGDSTARGALGICAKTDLGAPLFMSDGASVVGVNANITKAGDAALPTANLHARVDAAARHDVAKWLEAAGAKTTRACSDDDGGCKPLPSASDGGKSADASKSDARASAPPPPVEDEDTTADEDDDTDFSEDEPTTKPKANAPPKKAKAKAGGCSSAPVGSNASAPGGLALALAALVAVRRRKR